MMMRGRWAFAAVTALAVGACGGDGGNQGGEMALDTTSTAVPAEGSPIDTSMAVTQPAGTTGGPATVVMRDASGRELGTLTATDTGQGISFAGMLRGLPPGEHGIHVHAVGQCQPPFESAGPHWNPTTMQHGTQNPQGPHMGDMPNLTVGQDSTVNVQVTTPGGSLHGQNAVMDADGAAVVIHASADDYRTDPSGNSGARIACGVLQGT